MAEGLDRNAAGFLSFSLQYSAVVGLGWAMSKFGDLGFCCVYKNVLFYF